MSKIEIQREYTYNKNGKSIKIKRKWTTTADKLAKQQAVNKYFEDNIDAIKQAKNIKKVYEDYNANNSDNKVSYNMIYNRYIRLFDSKKNRKARQEQQEEQQLEQQQHEDEGECFSEDQQK